jgi:hypothetical protein
VLQNVGTSFPEAGGKWQDHALLGTFPGKFGDHARAQKFLKNFHGTPASYTTSYSDWGEPCVSGTM